MPLGLPNPGSDQNAISTPIFRPGLGLQHPCVGHKRDVHVYISVKHVIIS